jgi:hypothetical protein
MGYAGHGMRTKSSPVGAGVGLAVLGAFVGFVAYVLWESGAHSGFGGSFAGALFMGGGITLIVFGIVKAIEKKIPAWAYGAVAGVFILLFTAIGPSVSTSHHVDKEKKLFKECQASTNPYDWTLKYEKDVPEKFQRKEWRLEWMRTRIRDAKSQSRVADLRTIANECDAHVDAELLEPAKEDAIAALKTFYDAGKQKMFAARTGSVEFPVDNLLREGFATVIDELARSKDPNVYVVFKNKADLAEPAQQKVAYKLYADDPLVRKAFPKGNPPEIAVGDAFSPKFDQRRRTTFIQAMTESFAQVFDGSLITLTPLDGTDRKKKVVIEVSSRLRRVPDYFMYTKELPGGGETVAGLLFNFEVDWDFELFSNTGRSLYKGPLTTSKPSDTKFDSGVGNPDWVPYSVMMDSAYFNYSREVTGRFGLAPPPKKEYFVFTP